MFFPFSLKSASNWLEAVPEFLLTLRDDSKYVQNKEFHHYLASTLESFFSQSPPEFLSTIFAILTEATEAGKYVLVETLLFAEAIWEALAEANTIQPVLSRLALSTNRLYSQNAANLSRNLESVQLQKQKKEKEEAEESEDLAKADAEEMVLNNLLEGALEQLSDVKPERERDSRVDTLRRFGKSLPAEEAAPTLKATPHPKKPVAKPSAPSPAPTPAPGGVSGGEMLATRAPLKTPPPDDDEISIPSPPPPAATAPVPEPIMADIGEHSRAKTKKKRGEKERLRSEVMKKETEEKKTDLRDSLEIPKADTIHTHVHYYSQMNPRKTYPFTINLSRIVREITKDKLHILSGEKESETRGEFELTEEVKRLVIEPLISGCLVQPASQFVDPRPQNLPKELTFFVTPLVEPGFRSVRLKGSIFVKDERGAPLLKLDLPKLSVSTHRISKIAALIGTVGGGAMPAFDFAFQLNLQNTLSNQLSTIAPDVAQDYDMLYIIMGAQVLLFVTTIVFALLWWWIRGRAKVAPEQTQALQLPQQ